MTTATTIKKDMTKTNETDAKLYELYLVLNPEALDDESAETEKNLEKILEKNEAEIKRKDAFSKSELSYPMDGLTHAYTGSLYFNIAPENLVSLNEDIKGSDLNIVRWMVAKVQDKPIAAKRTDYKSLEKELEVTERSAESAEDKTKSETKEVEKSEAQEDKKQSKSSGGENATTIEDIDKKLDEIMGSL